MTWNTQDTNLSSYVPKANVDYAISGQGTGIGTLDHSATTPSTCNFLATPCNIHTHNYTHGFPRFSFKATPSLKYYRTSTEYQVYL